jgi:hypothetical protein
MTPIETVQALVEALGRLESYEAPEGVVPDAIAAGRALLAQMLATAPVVQVVEPRRWYCPECRKEVPDTDLLFTAQYDGRKGGCGLRVVPDPKGQVVEPLTSADVAKAFERSFTGSNATAIALSAFLGGAKFAQRACARKWGLTIKENT